MFSPSFVKETALGRRECFAMPGRKEGVFWLDHSLHTSFLQVEVDHIGREGLVDNIGEGFGHLDSIFSFARGDEMLSYY